MICTQKQYLGFGEGAGCFVSLDAGLVWLREKLGKKGRFGGDGLWGRFDCSWEIG